MKLSKPLVLAVVLTFAAGACSESDNELSESDRPTEEETTTTEKQDERNFEREMFIMGAMEEGVTEEQAECVYDTLNDEIPNFDDKFNDDAYELTPAEQALTLEVFSDCDALGTILEEEMDSETPLEESPQESDLANGSLPPEARAVAIQEVMSSTGLTEEQAGCLVDEMVGEFGVETVISFGQDTTVFTPEQEQKLVEIVISCDALEAGIAAGS